MEEKNYHQRRKCLSISDDPVFKYVFARGTSDTNNNAKFLIETMLKIDVHTIEQIDRERYSAGVSGKQIRMDCAFLIDERITVIIEMQKKWTEYNNQRFSHYANLVSAYSLKRGEPYVEGSVYILTILDHALMQGQRLQERQIVYRRLADGTKYCADEIIVPIELVGTDALWKKDVQELSTLEALKLWIKYSHREEYQEQMKKIREKEEGIDMLERTVEHVMNATEEFFMLKDKVDAYYDQKEREDNEKKMELIQKKYEEEQLLRKQEQQLHKQDQIRLEKEQQLRKQEQKRLEEEQRLRKQEQMRLEEEQQKRKLIIKKLSDKGNTMEEIADIMDIDIQEVEAVLKVFN